MGTGLVRSAAMRRWIIAAVLLVALDAALAQGGEALPAEAAPPAPAPAAEPPAPRAPKAATPKKKKDAPAAVPPLAGSAQVPSVEEQEKTMKGVVDGMIDANRDLMNVPPEAPETTKQILEANARTLFFAMMNGDARTLALASVTPFSLEDRRIDHPDEVFQEWLKHLRTKRTDLLVLYGVEILTPDEMEKKYGKPPARLAGLPWKSPKTYVAIGNLSGHAAIALFRDTRPGEFYFVGYTD